jgi:hypothetical protein
VTVAQLVGERGHRGTVAHVENMGVEFCDWCGEPRRRIAQAIAATAGEVDDVAGGHALHQALSESEPETLIGAGHDGNSTHAHHYAAY